MDFYENKEHVISSDEYSDDDDDDEAIMNDAVKAQHQTIRSRDYSEQNKQPELGIDQKQKQLSSLIRRNKFCIIHKNKSIKWLNNKRRRERYKERIYFNSKKGSIAEITSAAVASLKQEELQHYKSKDHNHYNEHIHDNACTENDNKPKNKEILREKEEMLKMPTLSTLNCSTKASNIQSSKESKKQAIEDETNNIRHIDKLNPTIEKGKEMLAKRRRSTSPSILSESFEADVKHNEKKTRSVSPQFYKSINDMFSKFDKIATNHMDTIAGASLSDVEDMIKTLSNEIDILNEILQSKEMEWNRLLHLKMVKEEIHSRLNKKWHILQLKDSFSRKENQNIFLELKELEFSLSEKKSTEVNPSSITIQKLIENRANMNSEDLKREKNNTSRLHSLLVSQNMLHSVQPALSNGDKTSMGLKSVNHLDGAKLISSRGRQGEVRDVKGLIADFRQKNPEELPRVGKRIKSTESHAQHQEKTQIEQYFTRDHRSEIHPLKNSLHETFITPIGRSKKISSSEINFGKAVSNPNIDSEDNFLERQKKTDFDGKWPKNMQYPLCQECKSKESRFVCAGCGNQWYCSKKCQISAWDKHSELCTE